MRELRVSSPEQAFEMHTNFVEYRASHPTMDRLLHLGYFRAAQGHSGIVSRENLDEAARDGEAYHELARTIDDVILMRADTVFLADELRELVNTAEATMPDEVLFDTDIYTPFGFVIMETPLDADIPSRCFVNDVEGIAKATLNLGGTVTGTRLYGEEDNGTYVGTEHWKIQAFAWADTRALTPESIAEIERRFGKNSELLDFARNVLLGGDFTESLYVRVFGHLNSTTIDGQTFSVPRLGDAPLRLTEQYAFMYGEDGVEKENQFRADVDEWSGRLREMEDKSWNRAKHTRRFIVALFRLMDEYVEMESTKLHRAYGRRATRSGRIGDVKNVTVLSLRRALYDGDGASGTGRKITMAHLVRGHWRQQWYPSQQAHRAKWIRAHRRGGVGTEEIAERPRIITVDR